MLLAQKNADGSSITVNPSPLATASGNVGVHNSGSIVAAAVELKAANGNIYSLAIQNEGTIRASTSSHQGGHIWLTADSGTIVNTGTLNASSTVKGGKGGSVIMKDMGGTTVDSGSILAKGGIDGKGGNAEVSGGVVQYTGTVDLTALDGTTGNLLFDPYNVIIQTAGPTTANGGGTSLYTPSGDDSILTVTDLEAALAGASITVSTVGSGGGQSGDITVANALTWTSGNTLMLAAANNIYLNADITATKAGAGLTLTSGNDIASGSEGANVSILANIKVSDFILQSGSWVQNSAILPTFIASNDFEVQNGIFLRVAGGTGSSGNPYQLTDVYGLEGVGSPSGAYLASSFVLNNDIDASGTATWLGGNGFVPIGGVFSGSSPYTGIFNGAGHTISGLNSNFASANYVGLFGLTGPGSEVENLGLVGGSVTGSQDVGGLVGDNEGAVTNSYTTGSVSGSASVGGLVGMNTGTVATSNATGVITGSSSVGGLVGFLAAGSVTNSDATGAVSGNTDIGGLVGVSNLTTTVTSSYATGNVTGSNASSNQIGGLLGYSGSTLNGSYATGNVIGLTEVGGLVGYNVGMVTSCYALGNATGLGTTSAYIGGLLGYNTQMVSSSYAMGNVSGNTQVGGLVGFNNGATVTGSYATGAVSGNQNFGGLVGNNYGGTVTESHATGSVTQAFSGTVANNGGLVGNNQQSGTVELSYASGNVNAYGSSDGGLVGYSDNTSVITTSYATGDVTNSSGADYVGGLVGYNASPLSLSYSTGNVLVTGNGALTGGLVGANLGMLENCYTLGNVAIIGTGNRIGGLAGYNSGTIEVTYSRGNVIIILGTPTDVGGLLGYNDGTLLNSYFVQDSGANINVGLNGVGHTGAGSGSAAGLSLTNIIQAASFLPHGLGVPDWDFTNTWTTDGDHTSPILRVLSVTLSGSTPGAGDSVDLIGSGNVLYTTTATGSTYSFDVPDNVLSTGALITDTTGIPMADTYYVLGSIPTSSTITGVNLISNTLTVMGTGAASNTGLGNASGIPPLPFDGINYSVDTSNNLTTNAGVGLNIASTYNLEGLERNRGQCAPNLQ